MAKTGKSALNEFLKSYQRNTPKDPPATLEDLDRNPGTESTDTDPAEVQKFAKQGKAALRIAREGAQLHQQLQASGMTTPLDRFLERHVASKLAAATAANQN